MPPGTEQAVNAAVASGRWEAVALVVVMLFVTAFLVYFVRLDKTDSKEREAQSNKKISDLDTFIRTQLLEALTGNTRAMMTISVSSAETAAALTKLVETLHTTRLCFALGDNQTKLVDTIASRVVKDVQARDRQ